MPADDVANLHAAIEDKRRELADLEERLQAVQSTHQHRPVQPALASNHLRRQNQRFDQAEYQRYGRQLILPEIGSAGQAHLKEAKVLIVGVGGLGCPAAAYLAGAGVGTIGLIDGDTVDTSNLHRQIIHSTERVGMSKVDSAEQYLNQLNPLIKYEVYRQHLTPETAIGIFDSYDLVLDCTDHPTSRYLISDTCVLTGKPLVSASALKTDGQLIVLNNPARPAGDQYGGPCYRCIFPKPPPAATLVSCGEGGILGPVVGVMGVLQALEAIKLLCAKSDTVQKPQMLIFTGFGAQKFRTVRMRSRRADCAACSAEASITQDSFQQGGVDYVAFCGAARPTEILPADQRIDATELAAILGQPGSAVIDTRDRTQFEICSLPQSINIPWTGDGQAWSKRAMRDAHAQDVHVICRLGNDSQLAVRALSEHGHFGNVRDVRGGFRAWRQQVDTDWPDY